MIPNRPMRCVAALLSPATSVTAPAISYGDIQAVCAKMRIGDKFARVLKTMPKQDFRRAVYSSQTNRESAVDDEILTSLQSARPSLWGHPFSLVSRQLNGEDGPLSLTSCNIFYLEGVDDPVDFDWCPDTKDWMADLYDSREWDAGRRIFSRPSRSHK